jgi:hypothetical protein
MYNAVYSLICVHDLSMILHLENSESVVRGVDFAPGEFVHGVAPQSHLSSERYSLTGVIRLSFVEYYTKSIIACVRLWSDVAP